MIPNDTRLSAARAYRGDVGDRVTRFFPMVRKLAWHLAGSAGPTIDVEDLVQAGMIALTECAQKHSGPGEDGFAAYAKLRVRGAMVDLLRSHSSDARGARTRRRQVDETRQRLRGRLGREPMPEEAAQALGITVEQLHRLSAESAPVSVSSLQDTYSDNDSAFASDDPGAERRLLQQEDHQHLTRAIAALPERHKLVIQLYFVEELNLAEIAAVLSVSVPRVHQLKAAALEKLKISIVGQEQQKP